MDKKKKTALDKACEEIISRQHYFPMEYICPIECGIEACQQSKWKCIISLKQYFQEQADIPDGWDALKKKIKELKARQIPYSFATALVLEEICKEYGIEVDDEEEDN